MSFGVKSGPSGEQWPRFAKGQQATWDHIRKCKRPPTEAALLPNIYGEAAGGDAQGRNYSEVGEAVRTPKRKSENYGKNGFKKSVDLMKGFPLHLGMALPLIK